MGGEEGVVEGEGGVEAGEGLGGVFEVIFREFPGEKSREKEECEGGECEGERGESVWEIAEREDGGGEEDGSGEEGCGGGGAEPREVEGALVLADLLLPKSFGCHFWRVVFVVG